MKWQETKQNNRLVLVVLFLVLTIAIPLFQGAITQPTENREQEENIVDTAQQPFAEQVATFFKKNEDKTEVALELYQKDNTNCKRLHTLLDTSSLQTMPSLRLNMSNIQVQTYIEEKIPKAYRYINARPVYPVVIILQYNKTKKDWQYVSSLQVTPFTPTKRTD